MSLLCRIWHRWAYSPSLIERCCRRCGEFQWLENGSYRKAAS